MSRWEKRPTCPECGAPLSLAAQKDKKTGQIMVSFWCEGPGDDAFIFDILTGLKDEDLEKLKEKGKLIRKEMRIRLLQREAEPYHEQFKPRRADGRVGFGRSVASSIGKDRFAKFSCC